MHDLQHKLGILLATCVFLASQVGAWAMPPTADDAPPQADAADMPGGRAGPSGEVAITALEAQVTPTLLDFGTRAVDTQSPLQRYMLKTIGNEAITWHPNSAGEFGPNRQGFRTVTDTCSNATIGPGNSCIIDVVFAPRCPGAIDLTWSYFEIGTGRILTTITFRGTATSSEYCLSVSTQGNGTAATSPNPNGANGRYLGGTQVTISATPQPGGNAIFTGWTVNGETAGYQPTLKLTMTRNYTVVANFGVPPKFCDVGSGDLYFEAIRQLSARSIIRGFNRTSDGTLCFGPLDSTLRGQMAGLIVRPLGWDLESWSNDFTDPCTPRGACFDNNLWRNVGALRHYGVAEGYGDANCRSLGKQPPCFGPHDNVLHAQVISFIVRGMVKKGYWQFQPDNPAHYPNVPADSGHRIDLATYLFYVGPVPGTTDATQSWARWANPAPRNWFAEAEWQALNSYFKLNRVP